MASAQWTSERVEQIIGRLLQTGVVLSGAVVFAGGVAYLIQNARTRANYRAFSGARAGLGSLSMMFANALHGDGRAIIQIGLLLLIATPVSRVAFSIVAFWLQRDRLYVIFTGIVLAILLFSLFGHGL